MLENVVFEMPVAFEMPVCASDCGDKHGALKRFEVRYAISTLTFREPGRRENMKQIFKTNLLKGGRRAIKWCFNKIPPGA